MEIGDCDSERLSKAAAASSFRLKKILVPIDFSDCSKKALHYAVPFAKQFNAGIILLHVVPIHCAIGCEYDLVDYEPLPEVDLRNDAARKLTALAEEFVPHRIPVQIETCHGAESAQIAHAAKALEAELIVISTHGRTGRAHSLAGSVAENLVQLAPCPTLVVREHEHEFIQSQTAA